MKVLKPGFEVYRKENLEQPEKDLTSQELDILIDIAEEVEHLSVEYKNKVVLTSRELARLSSEFQAYAKEKEWHARYHATGLGHILWLAARHGLLDIVISIDMDRGAWFYIPAPVVFRKYRTKQQIIENHRTQRRRFENNASSPIAFTEYY